MNVRGMLVGLLVLGAFVVDASADEGKWLVRGRIIDIAPNSGNDANRAAELGSDDLEVKDRIAPEVDISYFFTPNFALELILTYPQKHDVELNGTEIGSVKHLPPTLTAQWHFLPEGPVDPYVGAGINATFFSDVQLADGAIDADDTSFGWAAQAGADFKVADQWVINADVKYVKIDTDLELKASGQKLTNLQIDPWIFGVGVGYRF